MNRPTIYTLVALTSMLMLTSCAKHHQIITDTFVDSESVAAEFPKGASFAVVPVKEDNVLFSKETKKKIETILKDKGYCIAAASDAEYTILFDVAVVECPKTHTVSHHIPGETQVTKGTTHANSGDTSYEQVTKTTGATVYVPETYEVFSHSLSLAVHNTARRANNPADIPVWTGKSISEEKSDDVREVINYLLVSSFDYFGKNSGKHIESKIKEGSKAVKNLN